MPADKTRHSELAPDPTPGDTSTPLGLPFSCPDSVVVDGISVAAVIAAVSGGDADQLASLRVRSGRFATDFDRLAAIAQCVRRRDDVGATQALSRVEAPQWRVPASILCALAVAAAGDIRAGLAIANRLIAEVDDRVVREAPNFDEVAPELAAQRAIINPGLRCLAELERTAPRPATPPSIPSPFCYLVSYPRSGNTMLSLFLSFTFDAQRYSVYPGDGRYFSRHFHDPGEGDAVFVKAHEWREDYANENVLAIVRDGRDATVSYARFLYALGEHSHIGPGELTDFMRFVTEQGFGFWGDHARQILDARERGARIRIVRYEDLFRNFAGLYDVARALADGGAVPSVDEAGWDVYMARLRSVPWPRGWTENLPLPEGSFVPANWSVGGGTIDWRKSFDERARRYFHELGGTEALQMLGYEDDEEWWREG